MHAHPGSGPAGVGLCVALLVSVAACGSSLDRPSVADEAAARARTAERTTRTVLTDVAGSHRSLSGPALRTVVLAAATELAGYRYRFGSQVGSDGSVTVLMAFDGTAIRSAGVDYEQQRARLCVQYRVRPAASEPVTVRDHSCSAELVDPRAPIPQADTFPTLDR